MPDFGSAAFALLMASAFTTSLRADLKIRIREADNGSITSRTEYYKDRFWRRDQGPYVSLIVDSAGRRTIEVFPQRREYVVHTVTRPAEPPHSDNTFLVEIETRDTGERRQVFGHTARHFITTEHRQMEHRDQPPSDIKDIVTDGWYLDIPGHFPGLSGIGTVAFLTTSVAPANRTGPPEVPFVIKTHGRGPEGLAIREQTADRLREVTELSEAPLDPKLFEPPSGFRRVERLAPAQRLSFTGQVQFYWQQFLDWLGAA